VGIRGPAHENRLEYALVAAEVDGEWDVDTGRGAILLKRATARNDCRTIRRGRDGCAEPRPGLQSDR